jgi:hypothetical protein
MTEVIKEGELGIENTNAAIEDAVVVLTDIRNKVTDGLEPIEIFQIITGNTDEVVRIINKRKEIAAEFKDLQGTIMEGETSQVIAKFVEVYQAKTPEEEKMVEAIVIAAFAVKDAIDAVGEFRESLKEPEE